MPLLKGAVCAQYVRCGKATCTCRTGEGHGPYYYRVWREGKTIHKVYVRSEEVESVRAACAAYREYQEQLKQARTERERLARNIKQQSRALKRLQA